MMRRDTDRDTAGLPDGLPQWAIDFAWRIWDLQQGGGSGGHDYQGATAQETLLTWARCIQRVCRLNVAQGDDLLAVTGAQVDCCRECIRQHPTRDEHDRPDKKLMAATKKGT